MSWRQLCGGLLTTCLLPASVWAQGPPTTGTIRGVVIATDGTPLDKVAVRVVDTGQIARTGTDGRFELSDVPVGVHELLVSAVDLVRVRRSISVAAGATVDLRIALTEGAGAYTEKVGVGATAVSREETTVASQQTLGSRDLQQLRGLMTNDPFRAIQALPGVASGDDLRSEFVVRGLSADHMAFTFEGITTPFLVHTVQGLQDGGSVAMINGDILDGISLSHGSYPELYGNRIGAELDFRLREGSREGIRGHVGVSMTDASAVAEGPIGHAKQGSWLVSFRQSYLEQLLRRIYPDDNFGFGFNDAQGKIVYDVTPRHQIQFALTAGHSRFQQQPSSIGISSIKDGRNALAIGVASWRFTVSPRFVLTQRVGVSANTFDNTNRDDLQLGHGRSTDVLYRAEWTSVITSQVSLQGGGELRRSSSTQFEQDLSFNSNTFRVTENFSGSGLASSAYVVGDLRLGRTIVTPGVRVDHWSANQDTTISPWVQANHALTSSLRLRGGGGVYRQEPGLTPLFGLRSDPLLRPERAYHADVGIEGRLRGSVSWQVTAFNREDRDLIRLPGEIRLVNGVPSVPAPNSPYRNALDGHARGVELLLTRRSPNGLSGWVSYDYALTRYSDHGTGEVFWGDYDQRHTLNAYATYRHSDRTSFSARFRAGSNFPAPGYWTVRDGDIFLGETKNDVRVPVYSRLDVRANRTFDWGTKRLTLFVEVVNVYNRTNLRAVPPGIVGRQFRVVGLFDSMFPLIPSVGFLLNF